MPPDDATPTPAQIRLRCLNGNPAPATIYWRRPALGGGSWSATGIVSNPAYRIICSNPNGGGQALGIPTISAVGSAANMVRAVATRLSI